MDNTRHTFHPSVIIVYFIRDIRKWLFLIILVGVDLNSRGLYAVIGLSALLLFILTRSVIKYLTHTYTVTSEKVIVYKGVFRKKETEISYDRMQTLKQQQWFFFKPFNVVEVLIETASTSPGEAEATLTAVDYSLLDKIEQFRNKAAGREKPDDLRSEPSTLLYQLTKRDIGLYALTDMTVILALVAIGTFAMEWIPESLYSSIRAFIDSFGGNLRILLVILGISAIGVLSLLKNFVLFYDYRVSRDDETLTIEQGLFERKIQKIPLKKIQGIRVYKQFFRTRFKRSSVELLIMGGHEKEGSALNAGKVYLFPLIKNDHVYAQLAHFLPNITLLDPDMRPVSKGTLWYFWRFYLLIGLPLIVAAFQFNRLLGIGLISALTVALLVGWEKSRVQGYAIQENNLLCMQTFLGLSTVQLFIQRKNIQAFEQSTTLWLAKKQRGHVKLSFKEGDLPAEFSLRFISQTDSAAMHEAFWNKKSAVIPSPKPVSDQTVN